MNWIEISVGADGEAAEAVSELFNRLNGRPDGQGGAVTEVAGFDPVGESHHLAATVRTYLPADAPDTPDRLRKLEEGLWYLGRLHRMEEPQVRSLAEEDWANAWKAHYHPLQVGRFLVIPAWQAETVPVGADDLPLILDPGMAFGTGLHPSTQLCLLAMQDSIRPGQSVLDAGCGSGILSIAALHLGAAEVDAFDIDPIAVSATLQNAALNNLHAPIRAVVSTGPGDGPLWFTEEGHRRRWNVILINILLPVIADLLERGISDYVGPGGRMILAGVIVDQEPELLAILARHNLTVMKRLTQGDWLSVVVAA